MIKRNSNKVSMMKTEKMKSIAIVGGGASGMMAACAAAESGHEVTLFEHREKLGKKLSITGNGRCNLTNACDKDGIIARSVRNGKFLYSAVNGFDNSDVMEFFESHGLPLKEESDGRVFPRSDKAADVVRTLKNAIRDEGVAVKLNAEVTDIAVEEGRVRGVVYSPADVSGLAGGRSEHGRDRRIFPCDAVIMATGGRSCPYTGSDGSGWEILSRHGHTVTDVRPALVGLNTRESYITAMQGISLHDVTLTLRDGERTLFAGAGDLLFTHKGISGPLAITASSYIPDEAFRSTVRTGGAYRSPDHAGADNMLCKSLSFEIDLKPSVDDSALDAQILGGFGENINRRFRNSLGHLLPSGMIPAVVALSGINPDKRVNEVTREERRRLMGVIRNFPGTVTGTGSWDEAIITRGGIPVGEVFPSTMESRLVRGLYLCGEMLDVDALTGGFNLQIAWSTGHLAGLVL